MKVQYKVLIGLLLWVYSGSSSFAQGELWGMIEDGGTFGNGVLFKTDSTGSNMQLMHTFAGGTDGSTPSGNLLYASNRKLYGLTSLGGTYNKGTLFEYNLSTNVYNKLVDFDSINGSNPNSSLIQATDGYIYGVTPLGGSSNFGVIFKYDPFTISFSKIFDFPGGAFDGFQTCGNLCQALNGKLYGMTTLGGVFDYGTLYEYDLSSNLFTRKLEFDPVPYGRYPYGSLMLASNGKLYGMTNEGGAFVNGVLFEYDADADVFTKRVDFSNANGAHPWGTNLLEADNGKLYGMTSEGGTSSSGIIFEYDPSLTTFTKKIDLDGVNENYPMGSLCQAYTGKFFGMTNGGGTSGSGVVFQYDAVANAVTKTVNFNNSNGQFPTYNSFVEVNNDVWPGDCNNDLTVDNADFLYLGIAYNETGSTRTNASLAWTPQPCVSWTQAFKYGINHKHADTNGDGVTDGSDATAISQNYNKTHRLHRTFPVQQTPSSDFYLVADRLTVAPGDPVTFELHLGDLSADVDSVYGIAYSLLFDQGLIDTTFTPITYTPGFLGIMGFSMKSFEKDFYYAGKIDAAITRINHTNATNLHGVLGTFKVYTKSNISAPTMLHAALSNVRSLTLSESPLVFNFKSDSVLIDPSLVGIKENSGANEISVYPNPSNNYLFVETENEPIKTIYIYDCLGSQLFSATPRKNKVEIPVSQFAAGTYFISVIKGERGFHKKIQIVH